MGGDELTTKSGLMVGLGETHDEMVDAFGRLREQGVQVLTVGQYLRPTERHLPVVRYWHPDEFKALEVAAYGLGFDHIAAGPLVRSSYHADEHVKQRARRQRPAAAAAGEPPGVRRALPSSSRWSSLAGCGDDDAPSASAKDIALAGALAKGGVVLVMRHAKTETATDEVEVLGDCSPQRNLSEEGREQAREIGRDVEALGVPVDEVLASPLCRAKETAELAFGRAEVDRTLRLPRREEATVADDDRRIRKLRAMTSAPPGSATVLVTHTGNIGGAFDQSVEEGDMLVYRDGRLLGVVAPDDWKRLAEALG